MNKYLLKAAMEDPNLIMAPAQRGAAAQDPLLRAPL